MPGWGGQKKYADIVSWIRFESSRYPVHSIDYNGAIHYAFDFRNQNGEIVVRGGSFSKIFPEVHMNKTWLATITMMLICCVSLRAQTPDTKAAPAAEPPLKVTILGSGGGVRVDVHRLGPSILVETSMGDKLLFDCGRGFAVRLTEYGVSMGAVDKLFLTHLHSDHILSIPDLLLIGWLRGRKTPLQVWGPTGTKSMMDDMGKTFAFDIRARSDFDPRLPKAGIRTSSTDIQEGVIYEKNGVKVTAFLVDHGPVKPAFGYRVDYAGHSVAMSGDTRFSENLIQHSQGVDLLIHEVAPIFPPDPKLSASERAQQKKIVRELHTTADQTAEVFNRVKPRLAVYAHGGSPAILAEARKFYSGPLIVSEDLMTIEIGDRIVVKRRTK